MITSGFSDMIILDEFGVELAQCGIMWGEGTFVDVS